jgi:hypothetical protein
MGSFCDRLFAGLTVHHVPSLRSSFSTCNVERNAVVPSRAIVTNFLSILLPCVRHLSLLPASRALLRAGFMCVALRTSIGLAPFEGSRLDLSLMDEQSDTDGG